MGGAEGAQGGLRAFHVAPHGARAEARSVFHSEKHGTGPDLPLDSSALSYRRSQLPHSGSPAEPFHALLLLHPRRSAGIDGDARRLVLSISGYLLSQRSQLHREGAEPGEGELPQERQ